MQMHDSGNGGYSSGNLGATATSYSSSSHSNPYSETEYRRHFGQYKTSDPEERQRMAQAIVDLKTKNKEGLSYSTLFEHGRTSANQDISVISE
jgi:hypothetical protein